MKTNEEMASLSANLKIECTGKIDNTKDTYIYVSVWDSPKGTDKVGDRKNEITYMFFVRMIFWKTTHKKAWFATAWNYSADAILDSSQTIAGLPVNARKVVPATEFTVEQKALADAIKTFIDDDIVEVVEIKDWWLNAFRGAIQKQIRDFVKRTTNHRCCVYSVPVTDHTQLMMDIVNNSCCSDCKEVIDLPKPEKGVIHNSEFDYDEHLKNPPTLCDLPISKIH